MKKSSGHPMSISQGLKYLQIHVIVRKQDVKKCTVNAWLGENSAHQNVIVPTVKITP